MSVTSPSVHDKNDKLWLQCQFHDDEQTSIKKPDELGITRHDFAPRTNEAIDVLDRIQGSMFGLTVGDALGAHVEFRPYSFMISNPVKDLEGGGTWGLQPGQFTDDTSMAICLANSLIGCRGFVPYDQLVRYKWWYRHGYMSSTGHCFDIGAATRDSIQEFEKRQKRFAHDNDILLEHIDSLSDLDLLRAFDVQCSRMGVAGNGALMRLAPVPLFFFRRPEMAVEYSGISGQITHGDEKAYDACCYYGALIVAALQGAQKDALLSDRFYENHRDWFGDRALQPEVMAIAKGSYKRPGGYQDGIRGKGYIVSALEAALWAFWSDKGSFETGVLSAVNLGDDTDTTSAIYGQLAGAHYGYKKLPDKWLQRVYAKEFIMCISSWINYEGYIWFINQATPDIKELINSARRNSIPSKSIVSTVYTSDSLLDRNISLTKDTTSNIIIRKAIGSRGNIGDLYDGWNDRILTSSSFNLSVNSEKFYPSLICRVISGEKLENQNILRFIDCPVESRLSILSNLMLPSGITSVINYPFVIDECTRIFYYSYLVRKKTSLGEHSIQKQEIATTSATHVIGAIDYGIDVVVVMELPPDDPKTIDASLNQICECLKNKNELNIDRNALDRILSTHVYSNRSNLENQRTVFHVYQEILKMKKRHDTEQHCSYILYPINIFISYQNQHKIIYAPIAPSIARRVEEHWLRLLSIEKMQQTFQKNTKSDIPKTDLKEKFEDVCKKFSTLTKQYDEEKKKSRELISRIRQGKEPSEALERHLKIMEEETKLKHTIDDLKHELRTLEEKQNFIKDLKEKGFDYWDAAKFNIKQGETDDMIQRKLLKEQRQQRLVCSNDNLNETNWPEFQNICTYMINERMTNPKLHIVYVDFTYCPLQLDMFKIFPSWNYNSISSVRNSFIDTPKKGDSQIVMPCAKTMINVIFIGKSGVGKSTLINTISNCQQYSELSEIRSRNNALRILVSFVVQIETAFEHHIIQLGDNDRNEDYNCSDQSRTQRCKSYTFNLKHGQQLRIIDTPGFSHLQDQAGNDINMQHVLSYISNLTHVNAICVVMDSKDSEFAAYQIYLKQLLDFIGKEAHGKLVFCFTKSLSASQDDNRRKTYAQSLLQSFSRDKLYVQPERIILFDSTFFLYLASKPWRDRVEPKCEQSWSISKRGVYQLLRYLHNDDSPYILYQGMQQLEYARHEIIRMIRPITEAMQLIFRNIILHQYGSSCNWIELFPKPIQQPCAICYSCPRDIQLHGNFWIVHHSLYEYRGKCEYCSCRSSQHLPVDYQLDYHLVDKMNYQQDQLINWDRQLFSASVHFAHFLIHILHDWRDDSFLTSYDRMIAEESYICDTRHGNRFNAQLYKQLRKLRADHQKAVDDMVRHRRRNDLEIINKWIEHIKDIPMIKRQMNAIHGIRETPV
ncbi:unnamed protein product [Rotaria socialis]|uniref:Uncharacterized protein n=1 Tax=Rotaria socialis TaxID=392032 RepID=A0A817VHF3_9BILA|nr:unnamed protein product [Rotaria socialis]